MARTDLASRSSYDTLLTTGARTASSNGSTYSGYGAVNAIRAQLNVTAASGTTPTLDVTVEDTVDGSNWNTIGTFTQVTAASRQVLNIAGPFTDQVRARWVIGGTTPSFTFSILAFSK